MKKRPIMFNLTNLPLEAKLTLEIGEHAAQIEMSCMDYLLPAPKGIYIKNRLEPAMVDGQTYYVRRGPTTVPVTDVNLTKENIYNEDNKLVIPKTFLLNTEKFLSNQSILPYRGAKIVELLINGQLNEHCCYKRRSVDTVGKIMGHFTTLFDERTVGEGNQADVAAAIAAGIEKADAIQNELMISIDNACLDLRKEIDLFVGGRNWNMYFVKLTNTMVVIERYCDWRIYQWEEEHGAKFRNQSS